MYHDSATSGAVELAICRFLKVTFPLIPNEKQFPKVCFKCIIHWNMAIDIPLNDLDVVN